MYCFLWQNENNHDEKQKLEDFLSMKHKELIL
jgi:hypothetical protein